MVERKDREKEEEKEEGGGEGNELETMGKKMREGVRQGSRPMNKMHKVHSKFLRLFSFHREARFASSSPDYDIFSQHSRHGFAYFNVNMSICANSQIWICACTLHSHTQAHTQTHTHTRSVKVTSAERS